MPKTKLTFTTLIRANPYFLTNELEIITRWREISLLRLTHLGIDASKYRFIKIEVSA